MKNTLRFPLLLLVIGFAFSFSSCTKDTPFNFTYTLDPIIFTCPDLPFDGNVKVFEDTVITRDIEAELNKYGASLQDISSMTLKSISLNTTQNGVTFNGIDYVESYINSPGLTETKLAYKVGIPQDGQTHLEMDNNYSELADFIKADQFSLKVQGYNTTDYATTKMNIQVTFNIKGVVPAK